MASQFLQPEPPVPAGAADLAKRPEWRTVCSQDRGRFIRLTRVPAGLHPAAGSPPQHGLGDDPGAARTRAGLDVPIETKLHAPTARPEWIERSGLVAQLAGSTAGLILVDAPAGFGKTILVAQWRASLAGRRPFAWVSLDSGDNDPGRL